MATISERRTEDGKVRYQVEIRLKGYPPQAATFCRKKEAKRWAQATEAALRERRYFKAAESECRTVGEFVDRYMREILRPPFRWHVEVRWEGNSIAWGLSRMRSSACDTGASPRAEPLLCFFIEADRGTMPVARKGSGKRASFANFSRTGKRGGRDCIRRTSASRTSGS
jgi:hypothetical protein